MYTVCVFYRESRGLKLLIELYVEKSHSLWKEPEVLLCTLNQAEACLVGNAKLFCSLGYLNSLFHVCVLPLCFLYFGACMDIFQVLTWLEANCRVVVARKKPTNYTEFRAK